jgi:5-methylthioadenosine/S-adenosylhomocysteine deaminase
MTDALLVRNGQILSPDGGLRHGDLRIEDGKIVAIGEGLPAAGNAEVLDAAGMLVLPGLINAHMHSGENFNPGLYENLPLDVWFVRSHQVTRSEPPSD